MIGAKISFQLSSNCHSIQNFSPIDGLSHSLALSRLGIICTIKDSPQLHFFVQKGTNLFQLDGNGSKICQSDHGFVISTVPLIHFGAS